jgi:hypothetical protein
MSPSIPFLWSQQDYKTKSDKYIFYVSVSHDNQKQKQNVNARMSSRCVDEKVTEDPGFEGPGR